MAGAQTCGAVQQAFTALAETFDPWETMRITSSKSTPDRERKLVELERRLEIIGPASDAAAV
eukprot:7221992-Lingulodinium_polyedra.AAC.1